MIFTFSVITTTNTDDVYHRISLGRTKKKHMFHMNSKYKLKVWTLDKCFCLSAWNYILVSSYEFLHRHIFYYLERKKWRKKKHARKYKECLDIYTKRSTDVFAPMLFRSFLDFIICTKCKIVIIKMMCPNFLSHWMHCTEKLRSQK